MKSFTGEIVSLKTPKTAIVVVTRTAVHPLYKKQMKKTKRYKAHYDDTQKLEVGTMVKIVETRPISKDKHFKVVDIKNPKI